MRQIHRVPDPTPIGNEAQRLRDTLSCLMVGQDEAVEQIVKIYQMHLTRLVAPGRPKSNARLVHMLLEPGYKETATLCGIRVPALWHDIGLDRAEIVEFSDDRALITCEFCRAKSGRLLAAA